MWEEVEREEVGWGLGACFGHGSAAHAACCMGGHFIKELNQAADHAIFKLVRCLLQAATDLQAQWAAGGVDGLLTWTPTTSRRLSSESPRAVSVAAPRLQQTDPRGKVVCFSTPGG